MNVNRLFLRHIFALLLTLLIGDVLAQTGKIYYVNSANTTGDGETWNTAFPDLQSALAVATNGAQIWVAKGTYKPTVDHNGALNPTSRNVFFKIPPGVSLYGHFVGSETSVDGRNLANTANTTILSGDIGVEGDPSDNAHHVVGLGWGGSPSISQDCDLDGFTIQDGNANGTASISLGNRLAYRHTGGGLVIAGVSAHRMQYKNLIIRNNYASTQAGGAVLYGADGGTYKFHNVTFLHNESPVRAGLDINLQNTTSNYNVHVEITTSHFEGNGATTGGGAIYMETGNLTVENSRFEGNQATAGSGGAIYSKATSLTIKDNCQFIGNTAAGNGNCGGAIYMETGDLTVENSYFEGNQIVSGNNTSNGGAIATAVHADFTVTSTNNTFKSNTVVGSGGAIASRYKSLTIRVGSFLKNTSNSTTSNQGGGAIYVSNDCLLDIGENTVFRENTSLWGGGAILLTGTNSRFIIRNTLFYENHTDGQNSGQGGAIFTTGTGTMEHEIANAVFYHNSSFTSAGALLIGSSIVTVANSTFYDNTATTTGGALRTSVATSSLTINNCIILGNSAGTSGPDITRGNGNIAVNSSITQGASGTGITNNDPVATNPDPATVFLNTTDFENPDFLRLRAGSPAVNAGSNTLYIGDPNVDKDFAGNDRLLGGIIDLGANESPYEDIASLGTVPSFSVSVGTSLGDIILPSESGTVQATLTNNDTQTLHLIGADPANNWELIDDPAGIAYDPNTAGITYKFWVPVQLPEPTDGNWFTNSNALRAEIQLTVQNDPIAPTLTATWDNGTGTIPVTDGGEVALTYGEQAMLVITHDNSDAPTLGPLVHTVTPTGATSLVDWTSSVAGEYTVTTIRANGIGEEGILKISLPATANFFAADLEFKVKVNPRPITVTADPGQTKVYGEGDPTLTFAVTGLAYDEQASNVLTGTIGRSPGDDAGTYDIIPGTLTVINNNYTWDTNDPIGIFTITKAPQQITLLAPDEVPLSVGTLPLIVSSSSGLPITLVVNDPLIATASGTDLILLRRGTITVTTTQAGNNNYQEAPPILATFRIVGESSGQPVTVHPALSPNGDGVNDFLFIEGILDYPDNKLIIFDRAGHVIKKIEGYDNQQHIFTGEYNRNGTYFYRLNYTTENGAQKHLQGFFELRR